MNIVIIGPTLLALKGLSGILEKGSDKVVAVFTLDDASLRNKARSVDFGEICSANDIQLVKTSDINSADAVKSMAAVSPDLIIELGHSQIIKKDIINIPSKGVIGIHASMLPKHRGGASLNWALIRGDEQTGVSLYYLTEKVDDGEVIDQEAIDINFDDDIVSLHAKADAVSVELVLRNLDAIRSDTVNSIRQDPEKVTYTKTRKPEDGLVDWEKPANEIYNWVRAQTKPFPGAFTYMGDSKVKIWKAEPEETDTTDEPGTISEFNEDSFKVATAKGFLKVSQYETESAPASGEVLGVESFDNVKRWLLFSGIQNTSLGEGFDGGVNSWYSKNTESYAYVYSEITGYGITTLMFLNHIYQNKLYLERGQMAADWLIDHALHESGGVLSRKFLSEAGTNDYYSFEKGVIFTFDTGMVLFGLTCLYNQTCDEKILNAIKKVADFIVDMTNPTGGIYAYYNPHTGEKGDVDDKWSNQTGAFHAKCAMGQANAYLITKDKKYLDSANSLCDHALTYQQDDGRFITHRKEGMTLQHPHCYAAEGLVFCGVKLKEPRYVEAARKATEWSMSSQMEDGGIPQVFDPEKGFISEERTDILGQVLRLGAYFEMNSGKLKNLNEHLLEFQEKDGSQKGGLFYGSDEDGEMKSDLNSWCSMFALQAFWFYEKDYKVSVDFLI